MDKDALAERLKAVAYREGDFTLRSGRKSHYIIDKYAFETCPDLLREVARELALLVPEGTDRLAGVELGGVPLVTAVALQTGLPFVIVRKGRKGHGLDRPCEGDLNAGDRVALVEDVATTGGAAVTAAGVLRDCGAGKVTCLLVVDREEGAREGFAEAGIPYRALFTRTSLGIEADR